MKEDKKLEKLELQSVDIVRENIDKLLELFPQVATESYDNKKTIDFEKLKELLSDNIIDDSDNERYDFTWVGKRNSQIEANRPTNKILRPCVDESKDFDTTENLYIEGDNLQVLKLLKKHYTNKIKMIYIDPPYNTGKDFIYKDNFNMSKEEYDKLSGKVDDDGNRMIVNSKECGRYHSTWCSMIYSRLIVAKSLLTNDGVIFISIDDNEVANLRKICDEVFGERNFLYCLSVVNSLNGNDNSSGMMETQEYCLMYAKNKNSICIGTLLLEEDEQDDWEKDEIGYWKQGKNLKATGINAPREARPNLFFSIWINEETLDFSLEEKVGTGWYHLIPLTDGKEMSWYWSKAKFKKERNEVIVKKTNDGYSLYKKQRPALGDLPSKRGKTTFYSPKYATANSNKILKDFFGEKLFDYSKSNYLIKDLLCLANANENSIILDFFSGSATTAHAVMQLNAEDGGNRKFIMVQVPELTDEKSESYKAGYKNICEIGKERIRRAGKQIKESNPIGTQDLDTGFRVFKLDTTNKHDIQYEPNKIYHENIEKFVSVFKEDRSHLDLFFDCILNWGLPLNLPYKVENIDGYNVYNYNDGDLLGLFDENINKSILEKIANRKPKKIIFIESNFKDNDNSDSLKGNLLENFKMWLDMDDKSVMDMVKVI